MATKETKVKEIKGDTTMILKYDKITKTVSLWSSTEAHYYGTIYNVRMITVSKGRYCLYDADKPRNLLAMLYGELKEPKTIASEFEHDMLG